MNYSEFRKTYAWTLKNYSGTYELFCGPQALTEEGKKHFSDVLDMDIDVDMKDHDYWTATLKVDGPGWEKNLRRAKEFFYSAAGYCSEINHKKWFCLSRWQEVNPFDLIYVTVYCDDLYLDDNTMQFTQDEVDYDNMCEILFPREMVIEFYKSQGGNPDDFDEFYREEYIADDMDGLYDFCMERGYIAVREK